MGNRPILGAVSILAGSVWLYFLWPQAFENVVTLFSLHREVRDKSGLFSVVLATLFIAFGVYELYVYANDKNT